MPDERDRSEPPLHVVATAGHVDHGKSSLILRLTGMDPDRWAEEKRRGLTIDLGFAWCTLPSGRELGFVDVPGHERFVRNMLAGVGPVRLVLFVVAADEGWRQQSEEHLQIVDVLGVQGAVIAVTKRDLVDPDRLAAARAEIRDRVSGTALEHATVVPCSAATGEGVDDVLSALEAMVAAAPEPEQDGRPRQFVDRVFTMKGAGTVVTGTLTGGPISVGEEVEVYPTGHRARVRSLQTHRRSIEQARPVSRVAVNLVGLERGELARGDVVAPAAMWRPTSVFEVRIHPVRELGHPLTARGAFKLYAGSAERDAAIRLYGVEEVGDGGTFARIRVRSPVVLDVGDRFVLREAGRRETVAGGVVLDVDPPPRPGSDVVERLSAREAAGPQELPALVVVERGAVRSAELDVLCGRRPLEDERILRAGEWWVAAAVRGAVWTAVGAHLERFHAEHPVARGEEVARAREVVLGALLDARAPADPRLADALLEDLVARGELVRDEGTVRAPGHEVRVEGREDVAAVVRAVAEAEPTPPTVTELVGWGFPRELIEAAVRAGLLVQISPELVLTPGMVERAVNAIGAERDRGISVSALRERLGTSRKYAVPLVEHLDRRGVTRRVGDLRVLREP